VVDKAKLKIFLSQAYRLKARDDHPLNGTHCHVVQDCIPHFRGKVLKKMQLTCTVWLESLKNKRDDGRRKHIPINPVKNTSLYHLMTFFLLVAIYYVFRFNKPGFITNSASLVRSISI
jgi:hypothetical protein